MGRIWQDRIVEKPRTFIQTSNADGSITLTPSPGTVTQIGTPVSAANLNGIEADLSTYAADTGVANAYAMALSPVPTAYVTGKLYRFLAEYSNTGVSTLNVNSLGEKNIVKDVHGRDLEAGDIQAGQVTSVIFDGIVFQLQPTSHNTEVTKISQMLMADNIQGTIATPVIVGSQINEIDHMSGSTKIRTDVFTYATNLITEVRTIVATGDTVTFKYHTDTLNVEVI